MDYRAANLDAKDSDVEIIKKYGTTLLFAMVTKSNIIFGQVGDGVSLLFNDQNQSQLFKRHKPQFGSQTSSLASGCGIYSLHIGSYKRATFKFNKILLSTDGIFNKLNKGNSFALYANELATQVRNKPVEEIPVFTVEEIDVSEKSSEDCTIAAIWERCVAEKRFCRCSSARSIRWGKSCPNFTLLSELSAESFTIPK